MVFICMGGSLRQDDGNDENENEYFEVNVLCSASRQVNLTTPVCGF